MRVDFILKLIIYVHFNDNFYVSVNRRFLRDLSIFFTIQINVWSHLMC